MAPGRRGGRTSIFHDPASVRFVQALLRNPVRSKVEVARRLGIATSTLRRWFPGVTSTRFPEPETEPGGDLG